MPAQTDRSLRTVALIAFTMGGAVGAALIMSLSGPSGPAPAPTPTPTARTESQLPRPSSKAADSLVCVRHVGPRSIAEEPDRACEAQQLAVSVCEARLDDCSRTKASLRVPWPSDGPDVEEPSKFSEAIEASLSECGLDEYLEVVDCTEYPCVAAFRPMVGGVKADDAELEKLNATVDSCKPLRDAFDVGDDQLDALEVHRVRVPCDGNDEDALVLSAMSTNGKAWAAWRDRGEGDNVTELLRWMFRRGDDVAAVWSCR